MIPLSGKKRKPKSNRHVSLQEVRAILNWLAEHMRARDYMWFLIHVALGTRIKETLHIHISDFAPDFSTVTLRLAKTEDEKIKYIPKALRHIIYCFVTDFKNQIELAGGWIAYSINPSNSSGHLSGTRAYLIIREIVNDLGIQDMIPGKRADGKPRYRIGSHSCRRFSTTQLLSQTDGNIPFVAWWRGDSDYRQVSRYNDETRFQNQVEKEIDLYFNRLIEPPKESIVNADVVASLVERELKKRLEKLLGS